MRNKIIITLLLLSSMVYCQREFGNPAIYDSVSTVSSNSTFQIRQGGNTKTLTWYRLNRLLSSGGSLLSELNTWTARQTFNSGVVINSGNGGYLQLGNTKVGTYARSIYFDLTDSTLYLTDINGNSIPFKSKSYNDNTYSISGGASTLPNTYMTLSTTQTVSGAKTFENNLITQGRFAIIHRPSSYSPAYIGEVWVERDDNSLHYKSYNAGEKIIASKDWVNSNFTSINNYIPDSGNKTASTNLTFNGGGISFGYTPSTNSYMSIPIYGAGQSPSTFGAGKIWSNATNGELVLKVQHEWQGGDEVSSEFWGKERVKEEIIKNYSNYAPEVVTASVDTVIFWTEENSESADHNFYKAYYHVPQGGLNLKLGNVGYGSVTVQIGATEQPITIESLGNDRVFYVGGVKPTFERRTTTQAETCYTLNFVRTRDNTTGKIEISWNYSIEDYE